MSLYEGLITQNFVIARNEIIFFLIVKTSHYMFAEFSVRPHRTKHENKSSIAEISSDIRV